MCYLIILESDGFSRAAFLLEVLPSREIESVSVPFLAPRAAHIPWPMFPHHSDLCLYCHISFSDSDLLPHNCD